MENASKRLFFIQMKQDFFESEDIEGINEVAGDKRFAYYYIYLQMILKSLDKDGFLRRDDGPYTPKTLKRLVKYSTGAGAEEDEKFITEVLINLRTLGLVDMLKDNTLFMSRVPLLSSSKLEDSERRDQQRRARTIYFKELELKKEPEPTEKIELISQELFNGLQYCGYAKPNDYDLYSQIFNELLIQFGEICWIQMATDEFISRIKTGYLDFSKIIDKPAYFNSTIKANVKSLIEKMNPKKENPIDLDKATKLAQINLYAEDKSPMVSVDFNGRKGA